MLKDWARAGWASAASRRAANGGSADHRDVVHRRCLAKPSAPSTAEPRILPVSVSTMASVKPRVSSISIDPATRFAGIRATSKSWPCSRVSPTRASRRAGGPRKRCRRPGVPRCPPPPSSRLARMARRSSWEVCVERPVLSSRRPSPGPPARSSPASRPPGRSPSRRSWCRRQRGSAGRFAPARSAPAGSASLRVRVPVGSTYLRPDPVVADPGFPTPPLGQTPALSATMTGR